MILHIRQTYRYGFALPTVVVSSVVLLMLLSSAAVAVSSIRVNINEQYYDKLARSAAEAGVRYAKACLEQNGYTPQWLASKPLYPNTDCTGGDPCTNNSSCFVLDDTIKNNLRTTFQVAQPVQQPFNQQVTIEGKVQLVRKTGGAVWKEVKVVVKVLLGSDVGFSSIIPGYTPEGSFFYLLLTGNLVRSVGYNAEGQLGTGSYSNILIPTTVQLPAGESASKIFTSNKSHGRNAFLVTASGKVYATGSNASGALGIGTFADSSKNVFTAVQMPSTTERVIRVESGDDTVYFLTDSNNIYASGNCGSGRLGSNYTITGCSDANVPTRIALPTPNTNDPNTIPTQNIVTDYEVAYVRMQGGAVYGWGINGDGQLADGTYNDSSIPKKIGTFGNAGQPKAIQVETDGVTVYIVADNGKLYGAGDSSRGGQLGISNNSTSLIQLPVPPSAGTVTKVVSDTWSVICLTSSGEVWSLGYNNAGQLGNGQYGYMRKEMTFVKFGLPAGIKAVDIANSVHWDTNDNTHNNTYVLGDNGRVYGAGSNNFGQLGNGTAGTTPVANPVVMNVIDGVTIKAKEVQTAFGSTYVLTDGKQLYTVGNNLNGQLGDGTTTNSSTPSARPYINIIKPLYY